MRFIPLYAFVLALCTGCFAYQGCLPGQFGNTGYNFKCYTRVELAFVIDSSHSINVNNPQNFDRCKEFVKNIVKGFEILDTLTRVGVISYSNNAHVQMKFTDFADEKKVLQVVDGIPHHNSGTKTGNAIVAAGKLLFSQSREKVRKVLIILTEGGSTDDDIGPAKALKQAGVEIFVVGVGSASYYKKELLGMATDGRHVFTSSFKSLKAIEQTIKDMVCEPPTITYKCQCDCCGDVFTCTQDDVKAGFPCKCSS